MKTEELLRYQAMYRAMKERFQVRFIEYGFDRSNAAKANSPQFEGQRAEHGARPVDDGSRRRDQL